MSCVFIMSGAFKSDLELVVHLIWLVVVKKGRFKTSTQRLCQHSQIMSLLSPDLKFKESFIISITLHFTITSESNFKARWSLGLFPFRSLGNLVTLCGPGIETIAESGHTGNPPLEAGAE